MKIETSVFVATAGFLSLISSVAFAAAEMPSAQTLEKAIQANTEQKIVAETKKYTQIVSLAGGRQDAVEKAKNEVINTYKIWRELKFSVEASRSANASDFKAIEVAAKSHAQANKTFVDLQKDILAKNGVTFDAANTLVANDVALIDVAGTFNAAPPTAAGPKK